MGRRSHLPFSLWLALLLIIAAVFLTILELNAYTHLQTGLPHGSSIAEIPVGSLNWDQVTNRLEQVYLQPVEVHYGSAIFQIDPIEVGFDLDVDAMVAAADRQRPHPSFWPGFWGYLMGETESSFSVPLVATVPESRLRSYLQNRIETRYDRPSQPAAPIPGTPYFQPGRPGTELDLDQAVERISTALLSPTNRVVDLSFHQTDPPRPGITGLKVLMQQIIHVSGFEGIAEVYLTDLHTGQNIHFVYQAGAALPLNVAFSGWSTIKIPIMVSAFRRLPDPAPATAMQLMSQMITLSDNAATDRLAQLVIDLNLAPILVTQDMQALGLADTFWGGFFYPGAPLLQRYSTGANQRKDVNTGPDVYEQTTPADLGMLLEDIYQCSQNGGGALVAAFPDEISQHECQEMIALLSGDDIQQLIQAGLPYGTQWAHKHGWANEYQDGLIHTMGDAGIAFTPGGDFVIVVFVNDPVQIRWDEVNTMIAYLGKAAYNYFNVTVEPW